MNGGAYTSSLSAGRPYGQRAGLVENHRVAQRRAARVQPDPCTMTPRRAAVEIAPMIATGIAIRSGHGVATTTTLRNRTGSPVAPPGERRRP